MTDFRKSSTGNKHGSHGSGHSGGNHNGSTSIHHGNNTGSGNKIGTGIKNGSGNIKSKKKSTSKSRTGNGIADNILQDTFNLKEHEANQKKSDLERQRSEANAKVVCDKATSDAAAAKLFNDQMELDRRI